MGLLIEKETRVLVQGITGTQGSFHTKLMLDYGTNIVAGVTPGKGGKRIHGIPVYDSVNEAEENQGANASIIFVPAPFAANAILEAIEGGLKKIVVITEHIPVKDVIEVLAKAEKHEITIIGPNTPGIIEPGESKMGIMPSQAFMPGVVGMVSRSGTLTYEIAAGISALGLGQSCCIGIGGDSVVGLSLIEGLQLFGEDQDTKAVALIGEIGGNLEEMAAEFIVNEGYSKPVVAFVAGRTAPPETRMGHAGAIIMGDAGTAQSKIEAFSEAGVDVAETPHDVAGLLAKKLGR